MKKKQILIILLLLILAGTLTFFIAFKGKTDPGTLRVSGNIEATDAELGFKIAGRLEECLVDEGDTVSKGTVLARLENRDQKIAVALAESNLDRAASVLAELMAGSRPQEIDLSAARVLQARQALLELTRGSRAQEIETAVSDLNTALAAEKSAMAQLTQAKEDVDRFSSLLKQQTVSQRDFDLYRTQYEVAQNKAEEAGARVNAARQALSLRKEGPRIEQIEKAKAALAQAEAEYALTKAGPRQEKIDQAKAMVDEAGEKLNQAKQQLSYTELFAPMDGVILSRSAEPGEFLNPSTPVLILGDLSHPWLRAYVNETDLGRIKLKDKVKVLTDSYPGKTYEGTLSFISSQAEFTPKSVQTFEERVKLMFRIKIELANPDHELKPGMPADAVIAIPGK
ncbi:MAG: efflux RND transporter periplasmic adaptor subunit [Desulfobacteraceae bacterium]|nr:efflux RND transporter periplasmic adaptor subunit [Desulfobacteraceae bacterium]